MSEGIVGYFSFVILQIFGWFIFLKNPKLINTRIIFLTIVALSLICIFVGISWDTAKLRLFDITTFSLKATALSMIIANLLILRLLLTFPEEKKLNLVNIVVIAVILIAFYLIFFTNLIYVGADLREGVLYRIEGKYYPIFSLSAALLLLVSAIIGIVRAIKHKEKIYKTQLIVITIGTSLALLISVLIAMIIPLIFKTFKYYYLSPITSLVLAISFAYAITRTKLFNITSSVYNTIVLALSVLIIGGIGGIIFKITTSNEQYLSNIFPVFSFLLFASLMVSGNYIVGFLRKILKFKSQYIDDLKTILSTIDLQKSQEDIIKNLTKGIKQTISSSKINIFVENEVGILENIYSENNIKFVFDKNDKAFEIITSYHGKNIFFHSEIISDTYLKSYSRIVEEMFEELQAEVIVLIKDGEHTIMLMSLGDKENGKSYDSYDYKALEEIYPILFTIGYLLKNIRKQKTTMIVDRELSMSKIVIESLLYNISKPPKSLIDIEFITKSSSGLGGDFVDILRLGKDKFLIVVGDISGKGLTASMSMAVFKVSIYTILRNIQHFRNLVIELNKSIKENLPKGTFFSGVFILLDTTKKEMVFINAGIPIMLYYSSKFKNVSQIQGEGKILGFVKDISKFIQVKKLTLNSGDIILTATDGLTEATSIDGKKFDISSIEKIIKENNEKSSKEIIDLVFDNWYEFVNRQIKDDVSILVFKLP